MTTSPLDRARVDPAWFAREVLGVTPWSEQIRIAESIRDHAETAVRSAHSVGKDWTAAFVVLWFLCCHEPSVVISTAPTDRQVRQILWKEIGLMHRQAVFPLGGRLLTQELKIDREWFAFGFTTADYSPDKFQGYHSPNILVVLDEASGISSDIYHAIDGVLAGGNAKRFEIGNPTDHTAQFAKSFKTPGVSKIKISAFDTPNFTAFGIVQSDIESGEWETKLGNSPLPAPYLISPQWVHRAWTRNGTESAYYQSRVLAEFPTSGKDSLIPLGWIEAAQNRSLEPGEPHVLGLDVGCGGDPSVLGERRGAVYRTLQRINSSDTMEVTGILVKAIRDTGASHANVDMVGIGTGVVHRAQELGAPVNGANAGGTTMHGVDTERYVNARAQWNWALRERFEDGEIDIDPTDEDLLEQLAQIKTVPESRGRVKIEPKDAMKKRLGRSPDDADAMAIAFADLSEESVTGFSLPEAPTIKRPWNI